ncbi:MAG: bifunctional (p)ppGpp synthetase/guanosine-3',5'-bis(diphosphate) 3'-pyrophosphohydrolase [Oscillospiraceae bacterium]|nr:bifunctional (p)ppGpp synthetase/guanosine-3',5'-bis(diphosphate) 3'-pyrophosphohydrolase [Oscillospiraceae bacterium]
MESIEQHYQSMVQAIENYTPTADMLRINAAVDFASRKHANQKRKDGSPYVIHPLAVAEIVAEIGLDTDAILGALLHDCIEDTDTTFDEITEHFGRAVAELVEGVTKLTRVQYSTTEEQQMENLRKMFMAMSKDIRVILIKIADRLHNTRTLQYQSPDKQVLKSRETMDIYAPLAHRLGMQKIKWELEDLSLRYLEPDAYNEIMTYLADREELSRQFMEKIQSQVSDRLQTVGIRCTIYGRVKHVYSIYRKMLAQGKSLDEIYDLYAFRVIVDTIADCYNVLGHIHDLYKLVPGRFKDYISTPKPNMYQSLHTTVIGKDGRPFEVQIRTWAMHETAEYGIAAHWKYKQNGAGGGTEQQFEWVRRLLENQQDVDAEDYIHSLKMDMFDDEVFVFTPRGKVISLPSGSTPIDFAYAIHSEVGNHLIGAKINNRIASYDAVLKNGDIVEAITAQGSRGPSRDWLKICKSNQARIKIRQWFKKEKRDENIVRGKASFDAELRRVAISPAVLQNDELVALILKKVSFESMEDLYATIGYGGMTAQKAVNRAQEELLRFSRVPQKEDIPKLSVREQARSRHSDSGVLVAGIDSCMIKFARCCTPVPGDDIVGFITKGFGVSVHRADCPNVKTARTPENSDRWIPVSWAGGEESEPFTTTLEIESLDRDGLVLDLATVLTTLKLKVKELSARSIAAGKAQTTLTFSVHNLDELSLVRQKVRAVAGVTDVRRGHN